MTVKIGKALAKLLKEKPGILARRALSNPKLANRIKNKITLRIKKDGIMPSGKKAKAKTPGYVKRLKELEKINKTSRYYRRFFSNLTFSGRFLNSFKSKIREATSKIGNSRVVLEVFPSGDHKPYKKTAKQVNFKEGETITNAKLGQYLIDGGRDYTEISEQTKKQVAKSMKAAILKEFKLNLKRK